MWILSFGGGLRLDYGWLEVWIFCFGGGTTGDYGWPELWILRFRRGATGVRGCPEVWILSLGGGLRGTAAMIAALGYMLAAWQCNVGPSSELPYDFVRELNQNRQRE